MTTHNNQDPSGVYNIHPSDATSTQHVSEKIDGTDVTNSIDMSSFTHVLAVPHPAQGHVIPMMEFAKKLVHRGCRVTFVNTQFIHRRITNALPSEKDADENCEEGLELVSIPDGLEEGDHRFNLGKLMESMQRVMPPKLEELIEKAKNDDNRRITCVVAEGFTGWALEVAKKMGIKTIAFCPASASTAAVAWSIPKLIEDGIIDCNDGAIVCVVYCK